MALRTLLLRSRLDAAKKNLEQLRAKDGDFDKREAEIEAAVNEMNEETLEEDRKTVEQQVEDFQKEKDDHEKEKKKLEDEISELEANISEEEKRQETVLKDREKREKGEEYKEMLNKKRLADMNIMERNAFFAREDVKGFMEQVRSCMKEKRALTNVGLTIPDIMLPMIRQKVTEMSKLIRRVTVKPVGGTSRQNIMGDIPEAYWDEMCASLKELDLAFYSMEMDGYKVSGYFAVCNAVLDDSDYNLASELIDALGRSIGKALDKAILYGRANTNVKMPMGIVTSILKKTAPAGYLATGRTWEDLSATHVITGAAGATGIKLFQDIVLKSGVVDNDYETSELTWVMNNKTKTKILAESMGTNASAAVVAGMGKTMPVVGGEIIEISYIPDDTVIFGYFKNYILAERAGTVIDQSGHVRFIEDQTVFRGRARYDGAPAIREAFGIYGIGKAPVTTAPLFAGETASEA